MSTVVTNDIVVIPSGVVSSGLTAGLNGEIDVLDGGTLTDSLATDYGWIVVDNGGMIQRTSATAGGDVFVNGNASELVSEDGGMFDIDAGGTLDTGLVKSGGMGAVYPGATVDKVTVLDGGKFLNYGGTVQNTVVSGGGSFTVQNATANTTSTNVLEGATMRIVSAGNATGTTVNGGFLEIESGIAANTVVSAGSMRVNKSNTVDGVTLLGGKLEINEATANATVVTGGTVLVFSSGNISDTTMTDGYINLFSGTAAKTVISGGAMHVNTANTITETTLNDGELVMSSTSANTTVMNGGILQVVSGGTLFGTTVNAGQLTMDNGATFTDTTIQGGTVSFTGATITNIEIGNGGTVTLDSGSTLGGFVDFISGASILIDGTVAFDTALTTAETAQINGFSVATTGENAAYTLTDEAAAKGTYLLASDAAGFNSDVVFGDYTLRVNVPVIVDDLLSYTLNITETSDLALVIADKPDIPPLAYANIEWTGLEDGTIVSIKTGTAKIGYDAFALLADAIAGVTVDGTVEICGGTVSFADGYSKTIVVDAEASVVGTAVFETPITINGTVVFDTTLATETAAQFGGFSKVAGSASYILNVPEVLEGTYLLASDAATFFADVTFGTYTLKVGEDVTVGDLVYSLGITSNSELALTISDKPTPPPTPTFDVKGDRDGNGVSDVMFVWTGNNYAHGYWMNGSATWWSANSYGVDPAWDNLGSYDMDGDGKADAVMFGNVVINDARAAYIGYYRAGDDMNGWYTFGFLDNAENVTWKNKVGNLTGNTGGFNSIVWYAPDMYALGAWVDGTDEWVGISNGFGGSEWSLVGCGDFDGDGKDSVIMAYNNGQFFYTVGIGEDVKSLGGADWSNGWEVRAIGDFAGDGKDDIVLFHKDFGSMVMLVDGNADNYKNVGQLDAGDWFVVGAGDYNGDQKDDLLVRQYSTGMLGYYVCGDQSQWVEMGRGVDMQWTVIA